MSQETYYIVTNFGGGGNYTPSLFKNKQNAYDWIKQCTYHNLIDGGCYAEELDGVDLTNMDAVLGKASAAISEFDYKGECPDKMNITCVGDIDEGGNLVQLFEITAEEKN